MYLQRHLTYSVLVRRTVHIIDFGVVVVAAASAVIPLCDNVCDNYNMNWS